jgi:hypothetical protein
VSVMLAPLNGCNGDTSQLGTVLNEA